MQLLNFTHFALAALMGISVMALPPATIDSHKPATTSVTISISAIAQAPTNVAKPPVHTKGCTSTNTILPTYPNLQTHTVYKSTITATEKVDCGHCHAVVKKTRYLNHGPVPLPSTTVTAEVATVTELVCGA